ncbi:MAG: hypothetical protein AAFU77_05170 [Myxococcota bacterium]
MGRRNRLEQGSIAKTFGVVVVGLIVAGLVGVVGYLLSEINRGRYRLASDEGTLIVQRGAYLPMGFMAFEPQAEDLIRCYSPLPIPKGSSVNTAEVFDDRSDLDRALFAVLAGWSRSLIESPEEEDFKLAMAYVERAELLPGLSEEQRVELKLLRADTSFANGRRILNDVANQLTKARASFEMAVELGTSTAAEAEGWIAEIDRRLRALNAPPPRNEDAPLEPPSGSGLEPGSDSPGVNAPGAKPPAQNVPKKDTESEEDNQPNWRL